MHLDSPQLACSLFSPIGVPGTGSYRQSNALILHRSVLPAAKQVDPDRAILPHFTHSTKPG